MLTVGVGMELVGSAAPALPPASSWILVSRIRECVERDIRETWSLLSLTGMVVGTI